MNLQIGPHTAEEMALAYDKADDQFSDVSDGQLWTFRSLIATQFEDISRRVKIEFVDYEPYGENPKIADVIKDFHEGKIKVHTTGNESNIWGKYTNLQFRAVHDYIHCLFNIEFTHADEVRAFHKQAEFSFNYGQQFPYLNWETYVGILRSEIVYQSAYKEHFGAFHINQKLVLKNFEFGDNKTEEDNW